MRPFTDTCLDEPIKLILVHNVCTTDYFSRRRFSVSEIYNVLVYQNNALRIPRYVTNHAADTTIAAATPPPPPPPPTTTTTTTTIFAAFIFHWCKGREGIDFEVAFNSLDHIALRLNPEPVRNSLLFTNSSMRSSSCRRTIDSPPQRQTCI